MRLDKAQIQKSLTETVLALCQSGIPFDSELSVEGLLGITLDKGNVILVSIKEVLRHDVPKDLSTKKTEKRSLQSDEDSTSKRLKDGGSHRNVSSGFAGFPGAAQPGDINSISPPTMGGLRMPLVPPELANHFSMTSQLMKRRHELQMSNNMARQQVQAQNELNRMLALQSGLPVPPPAESPRSSTSSDVRYSPIDLMHMQSQANRENMQKAMNLAEMMSPQRHRAAFSLPMDIPTPMNLEKQQRPDRPTSRIDSPMTAPADLSTSHASPRPGSTLVHSGDMPTSHTPTSYVPTSPFQARSLPTSQSFGVVMDTNVQPPAPLAVVAGTGVLQPVSQSMEKDPYHGMLDQSAMVQPLEIVPDSDEKKKMAGVKKEKKDKVKMKLIYE